MIKFASTAIIIFIMVVMATVLPLHCQDDNGVKTIDGRVASVDMQNSKIVLESSETLTISVPSGTKIINKDGFDMQLSGINPGNYVTLDYYDDNAGNHIAKNIEVEYNS